jgi:hypothetical protein
MITQYYLSDNDIAWLEHVFHWSPCDVAHKQEIINLTCNTGLSGNDAAWLEHVYLTDHSECH